MKKVCGVLGLLCLVLLIALAWLWPRYDHLSPVPLSFGIQRMSEGPVIDAGLSPRLAELAGGLESYVHLNGPTVIRACDWVENVLGRY